MIITSARNTPVTSGASDFVDYKIDTANLGHIASILRKAYSDPIRAVIREYGTNACEAHILNQRQNKPFEVTLPTSMAPVFKIRDFGPGLGVESFKDLFCSYGGSSKRTSNQFTGCLGIGCKSYGSYTDSCTVTDIHDGTKRIWNCFIDESEVGKATMLSESKANDLSGVEIAIAIRPDDVERFRSTALSVYKVFDVKPTITNITNGEAEEYAKLDFKDGSVKGPNWAFRGDNKSWLQMGLVLYPLKSDFTGPNSVKELIKAGVYLRVNLGDVQIAPSREDLQYSQKTVQSLVSHLSPIVAKIGDELVLAVANATDYIEAHKIVHKFRRYGEYGSSDFRDAVVKKVKPKLIWNKIPLSDDFELPLAEAVKDAKGDIVTRPKEVLANHGISLIRISKRSWGKTKFHVDRDDYRIHVQKDMELFFNDTKVGSGESRIRHWLTDGGGPKESAIYVISCRNGGRAHLESTVPWFKHVTFRSVEALPKPPVRATVDSDGNAVSKDLKHSKGKVFCLKPSYQHSQKLSDHWNFGQTPDGETVFVRLDKFEWSMHRVGVETVSDYQTLHRALAYLKSISQVKSLYGVKLSDVESKVGDGWLSFHEALDKYVEKFLADNPDKAQQIADRKAACDFFKGSQHYYNRERYGKTGCFFDRESLTRWFDSSKTKTNLVSQLDPSSPFRIYLEHIYRMLGGKDEAQSKLPTWLNEVTSIWKMQRGEDNGDYKALLKLLPDPSFDLKKASKGLIERYPLFVKDLGFSDNEKRSSDAFNYPSEASVEYVRLIDSARIGK